MRWRASLILLAAVLLLAAFMAVFERRQPAPARRLALDESAMDWGSASVTALSVIQGTSTVECVERRGRWSLAGPPPTRAASGTVRAVLEAVRGTRIRERITPFQMAARGLTQASYGLEHPRLRLAVTAGHSRQELAFGSDTPLDGRVFAQRTGSPDVLVVTREALEAVPVRAEEWLDRRVMPETVLKATRVEIKQPGGFMQLALKDGVWRLQQPRSAKAADAVVERWLRDLAALRVEGAGLAVAGVDLVAYGLGPDDNPLQATVWAGGDEEGVTLTLGKPVQEMPGQVYCRVSDMATLGCLPQSAVALLSLKAEEVRDRRLCFVRPSDVAALRLQDADHRVEMEREADGWRIKDPVRGRADELAVSLFLRDFCSLTSVGFPEAFPTNLPAGDVADTRIVLSERPFAVPGTNGVVLSRGAGLWTFRLLADAGEGLRTVVAEEARTVYTVRSADLKRLTRDAGGVSRAFTDPLAYLDRNVLELPADSVRRITLAYGGREEAVVRDAAGLWTAESPPESRVVLDAVTGILQAVAPLRATRVETLSAASLVAYGLADDSVRRLTFSLSGQAGIQKTLLMATNSVSGGVYATLQGQDAVFVIDRETVGRLTRSMVVWQ